MTDFIHAMGAAVTGVTVVTTSISGEPIGRTVSAMCSVSAEPPLLLVSIRSGSPLLAAIARRGSFAVNVLGDHQAELAESFATAPHVFRERDWWPLRSGAPPLLHGAAARFTCDVATLTVAGTHTLVLGAVTRAERGTSTPLAYTRRGYVAPLTTERLAA
ncbi:flavin reductase family protein [Solirubrobacter soli]|uniref:flavin reductase family protein n=1 Tax=Solirubrobacter soli TaxID=363832 RepID=UPI0003F82C57|nr:flavin reductase family protein [Solirubrobacter soli]